MTATTATASRPLDLSRCLNDATDVYRRNFLPLFLTAVLFQLFSISTLCVLTGPLWGGVVLMTLRALRQPDQPVRVGDLFAAFNRFGTLVGLFFLTLVPVLFGYAFLLVPGIALSALWLFPTYLVLEHNLSITDALRVSYRIVTRRGFWPNFALAAILLVLAAGPAFIPYGGWAVGWLLAPLGWLMNTSAYLQEVDERARRIGRNSHVTHEPCIARVRVFVPVTP
jgi:hypothetical protein